MTQEEKELLLKDLCARLPYGVICSCLDNSFTPPTMDYELVSVNLQDETVIVSNDVWDEEFKIENIKPYLRPMSDMTEEETTELSNIIGEWFNRELFFLTEEPFFEYALSKINYSISPLLFDWLNAHHFDYRGLIKKGLALEAPEDMYK